MFEIVTDLGTRQLRRCHSACACCGMGNQVDSPQVRLALIFVTWGPRDLGGGGGHVDYLEVEKCVCTLYRLAAFCLIKPVMYREALFLTAVKGTLPCAEVTFGMCVGIAVRCARLQLGVLGEMVRLGL